MKIKNLENIKKVIRIIFPWYYLEQELLEMLRRKDNAAEDRQKYEDQKYELLQNLENHQRFKQKLQTSIVNKIIIRLSGNKPYIIIKRNRWTW